MGFFKMAKRFLVYGTVATVLTFPLAYNIGYEKGSLDAFSGNQGSCLERITRGQYKVTNPRDDDEYILDFKENVIRPYETDMDDAKSNGNLEDIFSD